MSPSDTLLEYELAEEENLPPEPLSTSQFETGAKICRHKVTVVEDKLRNINRDEEVSQMKNELGTVERYLERFQRRMARESREEDLEALHESADEDGFLEFVVWLALIVGGIALGLGAQTPILLVTGFICLCVSSYVYYDLHYDI